MTRLVPLLVATSVLAAGLVAVPADAYAGAKHTEWTCRHKALRYPATNVGDLWFTSRYRSSCTVVYSMWFQRVTGWSRFPSSVSKRQVSG